ncbi:MAG: Hint domain-containing protein [Pseudomonadota bacterium]
MRRRDNAVVVDRGEVAVENLQRGDLVRTADGDLVPVKWIGVQSINPFGFAGERLLPIRITAGALGRNLPVRDVLLSADHAIEVDGVLVNAGALVNGTTVRRETRAQMKRTFRYFHIETENHDLICVGGLVAETYVDNVTRAHFDNYAEYVELFGEEVADMVELETPRAMSRRQVPSSILSRIEERAAGQAGA